MRQIAEANLEALVTLGTDRSATPAYVFVYEDGKAAGRFPPSTSSVKRQPLERPQQALNGQNGARYCPAAHTTISGANSRPRCQQAAIGREHSRRRRFTRFT